jgi:phage baseplate assembly protein W
MARAFAIEDGNQNSPTVTSAKSITYKDIDLAFKAKPSGEIFKKEEAAAVKQAVKNILMTNFMEKPFDDTFGGNLNDFLFELDTSIEADILRDRIFETVARHEPRALMRGVDILVNSDTNEVRVSVTFQVQNAVEPVTLELDLTRVR